MFDKYSSVVTFIIVGCSSFVLTLDSAAKTVCGRQAEQFDTPIRALN